MLFRVLGIRWGTNEHGSSDFHPPLYVLFGSRVVDDNPHARIRLFVRRHEPSLLLLHLLPRVSEGEGRFAFDSSLLIGKKNPQLGWRIRRRKTGGFDDLGSNGWRGWQVVRGCSLTDGGNRGRDR